MTAAASEQRPSAGDLSLVTFLGTVTMLFAGFTSAYLIRRAGSDWVKIELPGLVWGNTSILLVSSFAIEVACRGRSLKWLRRSLILGMLFLAGQILAWQQLASSGTGLGSNPHASFFYTLTAVHGLHLIGGLGIMVGVLLRSSAWRVCANYWHFMSLVWAYVLILLLVL